MLVVRYPNATGTYGENHDYVMEAIDSSQFKAGFTPAFVTNFDDASLNPGSDHCTDCATVVVAEFYVGNNENGGWMFAIDGDDGVEMEVRNIANNKIVQTTKKYPDKYCYNASLDDYGGTCTADTDCAVGSLCVDRYVDQIAYYGGPTGHSAIGNQTYNGTINLAQKTWYRLVVRNVEKSGNDGVKVWYKMPGDAAWTIFGDSAALDVRAPNIVVGTNDCTLKSEDFIGNGIPIADPGAAAPDAT